MKNSRRSINYYLGITFTILAFLGLAAYLSRSNLFADTPNPGDNPQVKIYQKPLFSSTQGVEKQEIELTLARGQKESFELELKNFSDKDYDDLTIFKEDLKNNKDIISKINIDERVIHNWQQRQLIPAEFFADFKYKLVQVDELLVKNDKTNFLSDKIGSSEETLLANSGSEKPVEDEELQTSLKRNSSKKFVFSIYLPQGKTGQFSGKVSFVDDKNNQIIKSFQLKINVLAADLITSLESSGKVAGCFVNDQVAISKEENRYSAAMISEENFVKRLNILKQTGCESLVFRFGRFTNIGLMLEKASELGFPGPVILNYYYGKINGNIVSEWKSGDTINNNLLILEDPLSVSDFRNTLNEIKANKKVSIPIMFYGLDEPNINSHNDGNRDKFEGHKKRVENIKKIVNEVYKDELASSNVIAQVTTATNQYSAEQIYKLGSQYFSGLTIEGAGGNSLVGWFTDRLKAVQAGSKQLGTETYYFQGWQEFPGSNRFKSGFGFIKTGLSGFYVNPMMGYVNSNIRPIYLEDASHPSSSSPMKQMMTFYPASDGYIPTVQSEDLREGVLDAKYYLTYKNKLNQNRVCGNETEKVLSNLSEQIEGRVGQFEIERDSFSMGYPSSNDTKEFQETRDLIKKYLSEYSSGCSQGTKEFQKGLNVFVPEGDVALDQFAQKDVKIFSFNASRSKWEEPSSLLLPGNGYYIRMDTAQKFSYKFVPAPRNPKLTTGLNPLSTAEELEPNQVGIELESNTKKCTKSVNLQALVNLGFVDQNIYVVTDSTTGNASKAFKLFGNGPNKITPLKAGSLYWIYVYKIPKADDPSLADFECR